VRFFHQTKTALINLDSVFFNNLLLMDQPRIASVEFQSGHTCQNKMRELIDQALWHRGTVNFHLQHEWAFYYRDMEYALKYLSRQRTSTKHLVYEPVHEFVGEGNRVYTDMHAGDWWWQTQV